VAGEILVLGGVGGAGAVAAKEQEKVRRGYEYQN
jgi:hypothetical protein